MLLQQRKSLDPQISDSSDLPRPSKRAKLAHIGQHEATGGRAGAETWFNNTNNNACVTRDAPYVDDDPPFYLNENTYSGAGSACAVHSSGSSFNPSNLGQPTAPTLSLLAQMEVNESNTEDFRGVIDDLTIQNKRLRRKLKQYERLHCSHLQEEKLFEVRIHGLAAHRKRDLEEILRNFVSSSEDLPETSLFNLESLQASTAAIENPNPSTSSTSYSKGSKPIDSAYESMSGQTGVSRKHSQDHSQKDRQAQSNSRQQTVKSYLHDIPESLLPKHHLPMSEKAKSKLVVRRLEQIFTGKRAAGRYNQSHQQQEVSQSAAQADRMRLESRGHKYRQSQDGAREARILPSNAELKVDSLSEANLAAQQSQQTIEGRGRKPVKEGMREARIHLLCTGSQVDSSSETNLTGQQSRQSTDGEDSRSRDARASRGVTPDQRPTRPLDLDLHRAQVPSDNIEYIRHLGLASPAVSLDVSPDSDDGWIFLNLLTSMAQLHTLNVTPEFIRNAVASFSSRFELSTDGTKVRWQGGTDGTKMSADSDESDDTGNWKSTDTSASNSKYGLSADLPSKVGLESLPKPNSGIPIPTSGLTEGSEVEAKRRPIDLEQPNDSDKFQYKPLFFHGANSEDDDDDDDDSTDATKSVSSFDPMESATGLNSGSHGIHESELKLRKQNRKNGPIIFYNKARFCTDLSGDSTGAMHDEASYCRYTQKPIGCLEYADRETMGEGKSDHVSDEDGVISMDLDVDSTVTTRSALDLEDLKSSISDLSTTSPIDMEASGLGGIQPEDNFMVKVQVRHEGRKSRGSRAQSPFSSYFQRRRLLHSIPRAHTDIRREAKQIPRSQPERGTIKSEIISTTTTDMPPSSLPSASYLRLPFSSSGSSDGDDTEDEDNDEDGEFIVNYYSENPRASVKSSVEDLADPRPADLFLRSPSGKSQESCIPSTSPGSDDDSSIDFLANVRALDPDTIAAQEREFEINALQQPARTGLKAARNAKTASDVDSMSVDGDVEDD
ncbi:frequency clock protein [Usnea florida]